jgi:hypothetical protein
MVTEAPLSTSISSKQLLMLEWHPVSAWGACMSSLPSVASVNTSLPAVGCNVYISEGRNLQLIHRLEVTCSLAHTWT